MQITHQNCAGVKKSRDARAHRLLRPMLDTRPLLTFQADLGIYLRKTAVSRNFCVAVSL
ncbi:Uncharacterized protein ToN1_21320 [Aromatoleum petrolei]|nr:Uncharacterized protein ToN1_21320 [Aromatoleum petrolei]